MTQLVRAVVLWYISMYIWAWFVFPYSCQAPPFLLYETAAVKMWIDDYVLDRLSLTLAFSAGERSRTRERRRTRVLVRGPDILEERMRLPQRGEKHGHWDEAGRRRDPERGRMRESESRRVEGGREGGRRIEWEREEPCLVTGKGEGCKALWTWQDRRRKRRRGELRGDALTWLISLGCHGVGKANINGNSELLQAQSEMCS